MELYLEIRSIYFFDKENEKIIDIILNDKEEILSEDDMKGLKMFIEGNDRVDSRLPAKFAFFFIEKADQSKYKCKEFDFPKNKKLL